MSERPECTLAGGFKPWEKAYAQITFLSMGIIGTVGIVLEDLIWVVPYVVICWYGIPGIIMRHLNCPRCPHLHEYGDCLQLPVVLTRWLSGPRNHDPFSTTERALFYAIFILIPTYPLYWLWSHKSLLILFLLAAVMWYAGQWLYFCKRCRVRDCPFNRVPGLP